VIKVYCGFPSIGSVYDFQLYMLREIAEKYKDSIQLVYPKTCANRFGHDFARNEIVKEFLDTDCDILWFLDSDIAPPSHILDLITLHQDKWLVAGAPYPVLMTQKGFQARQITFCVYKGSNGKGLSPASIPDEGIDLVDGVATGCLFIKREVFNHLEKPYFEFKHNPESRETVEGEDLGFCLKLQKLGIPFFVDYSMACKHQKTVCLLEMNNYALEFAKRSIESYDYSVKLQVEDAVRAAYKAGVEAGKKQITSPIIRI
jgi:glycosyltransferase involved in cell wall biosynthesis